MAEIRIFKPTVAYADAISKFAAQAFSDTFVGKAYYTQSIVDGYAAKAYNPALLANELVDRRNQYFVAQQNGELVGYAKIIERDPIACVTQPKPVYLDRLYVARAMHGQGLGKRLMREVYRESRARGFEWMWLSVWEHNYQAQEFYKRLNFYRAGEWDWTFESHGVRYVDLDYIFVTKIPAGDTT